MALLQRLLLLRKLFSGAAFALVIPMALATLTSCKSEQNAPSDGKDGKATQTKNVSLQGAGATFPYPLYSKWMSEYNKLHPNVRINYQSIGSGGGIRQIVQQTVDFGASDSPMKEADIKNAKGKLHHIPTTIGAVVVAYNLPGVDKSIRLDPDVIVDIFLGKIKKWNDGRITSINEGVNFPDRDISVVHRSDGSGTTAVFTDYLGSVSDEWKNGVGVAQSVRWPTGLGAKGNEGVTGQIKTTPGAIGYIELAYAKQNRFTYAAIKNKAGKYVAPEPSASTAAGAAKEMPDDLHVSLANADGDASYPISAYTYFLVYEDTPDAHKAQALADFLWWAIHDGQKYCDALHYAPLPAGVVAKIEARLKMLTSGGKPLLSGG
jgi:phosphate transport system substrate-binding protein